MIQVDQLFYLRVNFFDSPLYRRSIQCTVFFGRVQNISDCVRMLDQLHNGVYRNLVERVDLPIVIFAMGVHNLLFGGFGAGVAFIVAVCTGIPRATAPAAHQPGQQCICAKRCFLRSIEGILSRGGGKQFVCRAEIPFRDKRLVDAVICDTGKLHLTDIDVVF